MRCPRVVVYKHRNKDHGSKPICKNPIAYWEGIMNSILKAYGMETNGNGNGESELKPRVCPRCKLNNPATNKFCATCGMVLDQETMMDLVKKDQQRKEADEILDHLLEDQEFRDMFVRKLKILSAKQGQTTSNIQRTNIISNNIYD